MKTMDDLRNLFLEALQQETDYLQKELPHHLYAIINGYLQGGGKRLRPCLLIMCAQAAGGDAEKALPAAVAVEEFHTWTLIHDDVIAWEGGMEAFRHRRRGLRRQRRHSGGRLAAGPRHGEAL